jgi:hypothetical protein
MINSDPTVTREKFQPKHNNGLIKEENHKMNNDKIITLFLKFRKYQPGIK